MAHVAIDRSTHNVAIEIGREALRLHHTLPPTLRAAKPVGIVGTFFVVGSIDALGESGDLVDGAIGKVEFHVDATAEQCAGLFGLAVVVTGIGRCCSEALAGLDHHVIETDRASLATVADHNEAAVPVGRQVHRKTGIAADLPANIAVVNAAFRRVEFGRGHSDVRITEALDETAAVRRVLCRPSGILSNIPSHAILLSSSIMEQEKCNDSLMICHMSNWTKRQRSSRMPALGQSGFGVGLP